MTDSPQTPAFWLDDVACEELEFRRVALDPHQSMTIQACAGSGKTWLLVARVVRLLLDGARPSEILAITFTRKAAEEMRSRVLEVLEALAFKSDGQALDELARYAVADPAAVLPAARALLERLLDDAEPMTIDTFHGWFGQIVRNAPLASGVAQGYVISEQTGVMRSEAWRRFFARVARDGALKDAYLDLLALKGQHTARALIETMCRRRNDWRAFLGARPWQEALATFARECGVEPDRDPAAQLLDDGARQRAIRQLAASLLEGGVSMEKLGRPLEVALYAFDAGGSAHDALVALHKVLYTDKGAPRLLTRSTRSAVRRLLAASDDETVDALLTDLRDAVDRVMEETVEREVVRLNRATWACGEAFIDEFDAVKRAAGALDFDDLELLAARLLADPAEGAYIQARLDRRYRHVLIDEFQDTNPLQWSILRNWLSAYGADAAAPRVFLVGDPTQSIYRFRRAEARLFDEAERFLGEQFAARRLRTTQTRRCSRAVVELINQVFVPANARFAAHRTVNAASGQVLALPLVEQAPVPASSAGQALVMRDVLAQGAAEIIDGRAAAEARAIAAQIAQLRTTLILDSSGAPPTPRDFLVLVRKRTSMPPIEAALRAAAIPYTTDRRGGLLERIEVLDLRALLRFLVVPFSNLQLAHVLRSPLFRFADDDLIRLATMTGEDQTWWQTLNAAGQPGHFLAAGELLRSWIALAGVLPVHDLLDRIYHEGDLVLRYAAAVPQGNVQEVDQVVANLAAFLELALELDSGRYPSLPRFIEELTELTRTSELDAPDEAPVDFGDTVRLMTIHGAKGLEAPVVILADSHAAPKSRESNSILIDWPAAADAPRHFSVFGDVNSRGNARAALFADEEQRADEEDWNLFYVAATRAREVLILSGSMPRSAPPQDSWYQRAARVAVPPQVVLAAGTQPAPLPEAVTVRDFRPQLARGGSRRTAPDPLRPADEAARQRGIVLHRLLELLAGRRTDLDEARALAIGAGLTAEQAGEIAPVALAMLAAEHLQRFFDARLFQRAASEVEFVDAVGDLQRLDRVVEFDDEVWVLDYKSRGSAAGIEPHRAQLEQYVRLLEALHPDKRVRGAIVFADAVLAPLETDQPAT